MKTLIYLFLCNAKFSSVDAKKFISEEKVTSVLTRVRFQLNSDDSI